MKLYSGVLTWKKMNPKVKKAYAAWSSQRQRCLDTKNPKFRNYGAKGIKVEYSAREFIGWYLENSKGLDLRGTCVGRIDHSKNYRFDNIKIETISDNSKERLARAGNPGVHKPVIIYNSNMIRQGRAANMKIAAYSTGVCIETVWGHCTGRRKTPAKGFTFRYEEDSHAI